MKLKGNVESEGLALKALSNRGRRQVYETILFAPGSTVTEICEATGYKQPLVSHYIKALVDADLIERLSHQTFAHCYPTTRGIRQLRDYIKKAATRAAKGLA